MEPTELLDMLRADPRVDAMLKAAMPYLGPLSRMAKADAAGAITNLAGRKFSEAHVAIMSRCETTAEILDLQAVGRDKALSAALDEYAKMKAARELILRMVFAMALAAL